MLKLFLHSLLIIILFSSCQNNRYYEIYSENGHIFEIIRIEQIEVYDGIFSDKKVKCKYILKAKEIVQQPKGGHSEHKSTKENYFEIYFIDDCIKYQVGDKLELRLSQKI